MTGGTVCYFWLLGRRPQLPGPRRLPWLLLSLNVHTSVPVPAPFLVKIRHLVGESNGKIDFINIERRRNLLVIVLSNLYYIPFSERWTSGVTRHVDNRRWETWPWTSGRPPYRDRRPLGTGRFSGSLDVGVLRRECLLSTLNYLLVKVRERGCHSVLSGMETPNNWLRSPVRPRGVPRLRWT